MLARSEEWVEQLKALSRDAPRQDLGPGDSGWDARLEIIRLANARDKEESTWLAFLCILIGEQDDTDPWRYVGRLYSGLGEGQSLTWKWVSTDPSRVGRLFELQRSEARSLKFANHRKFESQLSIPSVIASYASVVQSHGGSQVAWLGSGSEMPTSRFTRLLSQIREIKRFGRLAAYDFLVLLGSLGIYPLEPERLYLDGSTGPIAGARLLTSDYISGAALLDVRTCQLAETLGVSLRAMEDALCNWQKDANRRAALGKVFAYGSNLCWARLSNKNRLPSCEPIAKASLPGFRLAFNKLSSLDKSGKANIVPDTAADARVWGVIYEYNLAEQTMLDKEEGGYAPRMMDMTDWRGSLHLGVLVYIAQKTVEGLQPLNWYRRYVVEGARQHELPQAYIDDLKACPDAVDLDEARTRENWMEACGKRPPYLPRV
jgi:hypothetical protein